MYNPNDPRFRQRLNQISQNLESAGDTAQANIFNFSEHYLKPCFSHIGECLHGCQTQCFPTRGDRLRWQRGRTRGRPEQSFDFYDDWQEDEDDALLEWGNEEFDRLLGDEANAQPNHQIAMNYGTRSDGRVPGPRKKTAVFPYDGIGDPTVIPSQPYFGFLGKLPFKLPGRGLRYKPSAADLQERLGPGQRTGTAADALLEESESDLRRGKQRSHGRHRSLTQGSGQTEDSLSSRGDIFPSDEEDAVPLDDEFTVALERRTTGSGAGDSGNGKLRAKKRTEWSHPSTRSHSSKSTRSGLLVGKISKGEVPTSDSSAPDMHEVPSLTDLKQEELNACRQNEEEIEKKREGAQRLAAQRGLTSTDQVSMASTESKSEQLVSPVSPIEDTPPLSKDPSFAPIGRNATNDEDLRNDVSVEEDEAQDNPS